MSSLRDDYSWSETLSCRHSHLRVSRRDGKDGISWDTLQKIKNEVWGPDAVVIEVYPAEHDVVNEGNYRHLWLVHDPDKIPNLRRR